MEKIIKNFILKKIGPVSERTKNLPYEMSCGTSTEWNDWEGKAKMRYPKLYAVSEACEWLDDMRDTVWCWMWREPYYYLRNRYILRTHLIVTGLPKGEHTEPNEKLLFGVMGLAEEHMERCDGDNPACKLRDLWAQGKLVDDYVGNTPEEEKYYKQAMKDITPLVQAVIWWENIYPTYTKTIEALYESVPHGDADSDCFLSIGEDAKRVYEGIRQEEDRQVGEIKRNLCKVMECWDQLYD